MRVCGGKYRGMKLAEFSGYMIRPTADRAKESLFDILGPDVEGAKALDLFCGSGNLGIEALSRGAFEVDFNDISKGSIAVLKANLARLRGEKYRVSCLDYMSFLSRETKKYDIIFLDPPYSEDFGEKALKVIAERHSLADGGTAVYERDRPFEGVTDGLRMYDERKYGKTYLSFFTYAEGDPGEGE